MKDRVLLNKAFTLIILFCLRAILDPLVSSAQETGEQKSGMYYTVTTVTLSNGNIIERHDINGPPAPPPGFEVERLPVSLIELAGAAGINILTVPAYNWLFGCSAVSGAMIAGYYDRMGYSNIYTGPTNGGVMPLDNSSWPTWSDGFATYPSCPLVASRNGVDSRTTRGSIDDYWVQYNSSATDPYITNGWPQHAWGDAVGDYMMTSQSAFGNSDGSTSFYSWTGSPTALTCDYMASNSLHDGTLGRKRFYEARGYTVTDCYNQKTDNAIAGGFSFAQFKAEIDAGRPVMLNLAGHTVVGVGYDNSSNLVYIHDTWDHSSHTMTWGGSYSGMALQSVSIVNLQGILLPNLAPYQPSGWSDKIVVSKTPGTSTDSGPLYTSDTLYVDWAVLNNGASATASTFYTAMYVDGVQKALWFNDPPINANNYTYVSDYSIGSLSAGSHTIEIVTDSTGAVAESDESDNAYTRAIMVALTCANSPVKNGGNYYPSMHDAYIVAADGNVIQSEGTILAGDVNFNRNPGIALSIRGGYDCNYLTNVLNSIVVGTMTIASGTVTIEGIVIQ